MVALKTLGKASVIVSVYSEDRLQCLLDCVDSLKSQSVKPIEVIVVLDPEPSLIEFYRSRLGDDVWVVVSDGFGLSNARNAGVKSAKGDIVAFMDDDAVADRDWLMNLLESYADPNVVGVGGYVKPLWEGSRPRWFPEELDWVVGCSYKGLPRCKAFVRNPIGCNMSFRKEVFQRIGYFKSDVGRFGKRLLSGEEPELSMRILKRFTDARIVYDPSAVVYHRVSRNRLSFRYLFARSFNEGVSKATISKTKDVSSAFLGTENKYLRYLLGVAVPSRLKRFYSFECLSQLLVLFFSLSGVFLGFASRRFSDS